MLSIAILIGLSSPLAPLECLDAERTRSRLAVRMDAILRHEVDRASLNRAETGALRAMTARRSRLLDCEPERKL